MSMSINSLSANGNMMLQLQRMQQQMRTLTQAAQIGSEQNAAHFANEMSSIGIETTPSFKDELINQVDAVSPDQKVDNVGAFANMLHNAFEQVNNLQNDAENKQTRFDLGDRSVTLSDVMLATQKSSISFDATMQIRNKMIEAYKTISQMQI